MADLKRANSPQDESAVADLRRNWSTIPKQQYFTISHHASPRGGFLFHVMLRLLEIARVLVRFNHVARFIVNANHSIMRPTPVLRVIDCRARVLIPQGSELGFQGRCRKGHLTLVELFDSNISKLGRVVHDVPLDGNGA
jgi:hypothetical protein